METFQNQSLSTLCRPRCDDYTGEVATMEGSCGAGKIDTHESTLLAITGYFRFGTIYRLELD